MALAPLMKHNSKCDMVDHTESKTTSEPQLSLGQTQHLRKNYCTPCPDTMVADYSMTTRKEQLQEQFSITHAYQNSVCRLWLVKRLFLRLVLIILAVFVTFSICHGVFSPSYADLPKHYQDLERHVRSSAEPGRGNPNKEKVFIAANIIDEGLIRGSWGDNLVSLVDLLGKDNVFVSIYENDSGPGTVAALRQLQQRLICNSSIVTGDHVPLEIFPTVRLPNGQQRVKRITYLAEIRNRLLRPLDPNYGDQPPAGFQSAKHIAFDRILFLNDVYYSPLEALHLLFSTNADSGIAQYRAACAIDFVQFFKLYDTFVVRDTDGYGVQLQFFPWFTRHGSGTSRTDVLSLTDSVQVRSCWGGLAAFDASVFQSGQFQEQIDSSSELTPKAIKFRSLDEPFWEAAECCLLFADMEVEYGQPSRNSRNGVFLNPYIRTAYSSVTWKWLSLFRRLERTLEPFQYLADTITSPEPNPRRTHEPGQVVEEMVWTDSTRQPIVKQSVFAGGHRSHGKDYLAVRSDGHFEMQTRQAGSGGFCGMRRMFVMKKDVEEANRSRSGRNWEKIRIPWDTCLG